MFLSVFFFFSSRRRHTRYWRDWSSDVCSSDLAKMKQHDGQVRAHVEKLAQKTYWAQFDPMPEFVIAFLPGESFFSAALQHRSEERRVGKECRSRWSPYH